MYAIRSYYDRSFRLQPALLVFHVALLAVLLLAALGMLTRYEGRIELAEGSRFDPDRVETVNRGWLHRSRLSDLDVVQGDIEVDYANGLRRAATRSELVFGGTSRRVITSYSIHYTKLYDGRVSADRVQPLP